MVPKNSPPKNIPVSNFSRKIITRDTLEPMERMVDINGIIINCNGKYARMLGYAMDDVIGMSIFDHSPKKRMIPFMIYLKMETRRINNEQKIYAYNKQ